MKIKHFAFLAFCATLMNSCKTSYTPLSIPINNIPPDIIKIKKVPYGKEVSVKVININKDLYDVTINGTKTSNNTEVPSVLSLASLLLPAEIPSVNSHSESVSSVIKANGIIRMSAIVDINPIPTNCSGFLQHEQTIIKQEGDNLKIAAERIDKIIQFYNYLGRLQQLCGFSSDSIISAKNITAQNIFGSTDTSIIRSYINNTIQNVIVSYQAIQIAMDQIDSLNYHSACPQSEKDKMKLLLYTEREKSAITSLDELYKKIQDLNTNDEASVIIKRFISINASNYTVTSETIKAKQADRIQFTVSIKPKSWVPCDAVEKNFKVTYKVNGGIKVDFSSGIFGNFGNNNFHGNTYYLDSLYEIRQLKTSPKSIIPSIGGLLHIYYRTGTDVNAGVAAGASLTTDLKITNFHAGVSLMLNVDNEILNRLVLTGGLTWRYVKDLSTNYATGNSVDKNLTIDQLETGKYKQGGFVAFTWNLTKKDK